MATTTPTKSIQQMQQDILKYRATKLGVPAAASPAPAQAPAPAPSQNPDASSDESIGEALATYRKDRDSGKPVSGKTEIPKEPSALASFAKGIFSAPATLIARPVQAIAELGQLATTGQVDPEAINAATKKVPLFGSLVAPVPENFKDVKKDVGRAAETVALGSGAPIAGGALFGAGSSLEQGNDLFSTKTAFDAALAGAGGKALELIGKPLLNGAGRVVGTITPQTLKDVAAGGAGAITKFMADHELLGGIAAKPSAAIANGLQGVDTTIGKGASAAGRTVRDTLAKEYPNLNPVQHYLNVNKADLARPTTINEPGYANATAIYNDAKAHGINLEDVGNERGVQHDKLIGDSGKYNTKDAVRQLEKKVYTDWNKPYRAAIREAEGETQRVPVQEVKEALIRKVANTPDSVYGVEEKSKLIDDIEKKYAPDSATGKARKHGYTLTNLHDSRIEAATRGKYKPGKEAPPTQEKARLARLEESTFRDLFDSRAPKDDEFTDMRREFEKNFRLASYLRALHGKKVPAGITKKAVRLFGKALGASLGGNVGGFAGFLAGGQLGDALFKGFDAVPNPLKGAVLDRLEIEEPAAYSALKEHLGAMEVARLQRKALPAMGESAFGKKAATMHVTPKGTVVPDKDEAIDLTAVEQGRAKAPRSGRTEADRRKLIQYIQENGQGPYVPASELPGIRAGKGPRRRETLPVIQAGKPKKSLKDIEF